MHKIDASQADTGGPAQRPAEEAAAIVREVMEQDIILEFGFSYYEVRDMLLDIEAACDEKLGCKYHSAPPKRPKPNPTNLSAQRKRKRTQPNPDNQPCRRESKRIRGQPPAPAAEHERGRQTTRVGSKRKRDTQQANKRSTDTAHNSKHPRRGEG